jgi:hypothetical protein
MRRHNRLVFINCPFDSDYSPLLEALTFAISACGYEPRCALEMVDSGRNRLTKIVDLIDLCDFSVHDISQTNLNAHGLPRFNMPFELGLALGRKFATKREAAARLLVLDREAHRYLEFISDLRGCDPVAHGRDPLVVVGLIRDWLSSYHKVPLNGPNHMRGWFEQFLDDLPGICAEAGFDRSHLSFNDLKFAVRFWLEANVPAA